VLAQYDLEADVLHESPLNKPLEPWLASEGSWQTRKS